MHSRGASGWIAELLNWGFRRPPHLQMSCTATVEPAAYRRSEGADPVWGLLVRCRLDALTGSGMMQVCVETVRASRAVWIGCTYSLYGRFGGIVKSEESLSSSSGRRVGCSGGR